MQNRPALPFDPVGWPAGQPAGQPRARLAPMVSNGECSQLGSHGSYMNACMRPETPAIGPMSASAAVAYRPPPSYDRYVGDIHDDRGADRRGREREGEGEWLLYVVIGPLPQQRASPPRFPQSRPRRRRDRCRRRSTCSHVRARMRRGSHRNGFSLRSFAILLFTEGKTILICSEPLLRDDERGRERERRGKFPSNLSSECIRGVI